MKNVADVADGVTAICFIALIVIGFACSLKQFSTCYVIFSVFACFYSFLCVFRLNVVSVLFYNPSSCEPSIFSIHFVHQSPNFKKAHF